MNYQARLLTPFGMVGIRCDVDTLIGIDFLEEDALPQSPSQAFAQEACEQLQSIFYGSKF